MLENILGVSNQFLLEQTLVGALFAVSLMGFWQIKAFGNVWKKFYEKKAELEARARSREAVGDDGFYEKGTRKVREPNSSQIEGESWQQAIQDYKRRLRLAIDELEKPDQSFRNGIIFGFAVFVLAGLFFSSAALLCAIFFSGSRDHILVGWPQVAANFNLNFLPVLHGVEGDFEIGVAPINIKVLNWYHAKMCALLWPSLIAFAWQIASVPKLIVGRAADFKGDLEMSDEKLREEIKARRGLSRGFSTALAAVARYLGRPFSWHGRID